MSWPEGIVARPIDKGDAEAWADLLAAREKVDQEGEIYGAEDLIEELDDPQLDAAHDTIGLWADGRMIGYGMVRIVRDRGGRGPGAHRGHHPSGVAPPWPRYDADALADPPSR